MLKDRNLFSRFLLDWYKKHGRDLPWRNTSDPYLIWVSEIILQQTRVLQGYEYYLRFVDLFPDVTTLAQASEDEVMKSWQGLGYYSRARNMHAAAKNMNGTFPRTYAGVLALKGVGVYTAAAICSFAYDMPYPVLDGNVYRVLSRYLGIEIPIDSAEGKKLFLSLAEELLDKEHPALYNQAIMDFGAIQCVPSSPDCSACPLAVSCMAYAKNLVTKLPLKKHKVKTSNRYFNYLYVNAGEYTYINKRVGKDIWKNLFELPLIESSCSLEEEDFYASKEFRRLFMPNESLVVRMLCRNVKHVLSHRIIYATFYEVISPDTSNAFSNYIKIRKEDLDNYAVPRLLHSFFEKYL
ncbi:A/G-specific adenine glycosylase [uncultured Bacteroides sp.]|uniref:A/G-specific adenine glycosylase n=1 Tax=uncultured Bacteroides sp. TaxID=162156 RepID=UPI002AAA9926|nr:A/G-specific adenine glycosylase [uncultured Bacteroides sp.]